MEVGFQKKEEKTLQKLQSPPPTWPTILRESSVRKFNI